MCLIHCQHFLYKTVCLWHLEYKLAVRMQRPESWRCTVKQWQMLSWVASTAEVEVIKLESFSAKEVWTEAGLSSFFFILMHNVFMLLSYPSPRQVSNAAYLVCSFANHSYFYIQQNILPISLVFILFSIFWIFTCLLHFTCVQIQQRKFFFSPFKVTLLIFM